MKIIIFNDEREIIDVIDNVADPQPHGKNTVKWENGGIGGINHNYVIIEDEKKLEDLTDEEIIEQYRIQTKMDLALEYENNRAYLLASGLLAEEEEHVKANINEVDSKQDKEELRQFRNEVKKARLERRANAFGKGTNNGTPPPVERPPANGEPPVNE